MSRVSLPFLVDSFPIHSATSDAIVCLCCTRRPLCNAAFQVVHEDILSFLPLPFLGFIKTSSNGASVITSFLTLFHILDSIQTMFVDFLMHGRL